VVLLRGAGDQLETFWVRRSDAVSYMPGFRAFPGGTVNREDATLEIEGLGEGTERTLRACLVRETFEETGVLLASGAPGGDLEHARTRLLAGDAQFPDLAREHGWRFRADTLTPAGRWVSPPFAATRFETSFFLARVPVGQKATIREGELESGEWVHPIAALQRWQAGHETFAAPVLYTLIGLAEGEAGLAERMAEYPEAAGRPVRRIELKWGIVLHPMKTRPLPPATHTNAYLVGDREMALIDPGSDDPDEVARLFDLIELLRSDDRHVKLVLLTHHHPDHVAGLARVRERFGVKVAAHAETARHVPVDFTLADGDIVPLAPGKADWTLRAIHTPGHARGHLCFFHPRTGSLFTGDHITGAGTVIIDPPEGDMADYLRSLERLLVEPVSTLFPAHGSPQGAAARRIRGLIAHRMKREAKVLAALEAGPASLRALVERAYEDTPRELWDYAERSLLAHLLKLEREGRARRDGERWASVEPVPGAVAPGSGSDPGARA
jgi:glyoxylase-like metal-dependent hydrolase (beta-lactamase superfamily II)/8-oxo-dGTP pyrophosphatase MutT (NUDIX family)